MTKKDIVEIVVERTGQRKSHAGIIVECTFDVFMKMLAKERRIEIRNFGTFQIKPTPARIGRNPVTRETAEVPARNIVQFKAGRLMKNLVAGDGQPSSNQSEEDERVEEANSQA